MLKSYSVGEIFKTNHYGDVVVVDVKGSTKVDVKFLNSGNIKTVAAGDLRRGLITDEKKYRLSNPFKIGDILPTKASGTIEILDIKNSTNVLIRFLDTGNTMTTVFAAIKKGSARDESALKYKKIAQVGSIISTYNYGDAEIIEVKGAMDITIKFLETGSVVKTRAYEIKTGQIKDPLSEKFKPSRVSENRFCVYLHKDSKGVVKYVGNGRMKRPYDFLQRTSEWLNYFNTETPNVEIVASGLDKETAHDMELELIELYESTIVNKIRVQHKPKAMNFEDFNKVFKYDPTVDTFLLRKNRNGDYVRAGFETSGYYAVSFKGSTYKIHRVVWLLNDGSIDTSKVIDHIDGNKLNNNISNLRIVDHSMNSKNRLSRIPKCGFRNIIEEYCENRLLGYRVSWTKTGFDKKSSKSFSISNFNNCKEAALRSAYEFRDSLMQSGDLLPRIKDGEQSIEDALSKLKGL